VRKIALVYAAVAEEEKAAHDRLRRTLGFVLRGPHHAYNLELGGAALEQPALATAYAREDWAAVDRLVSDDVVRSHAASGTPAQFRAALERYQSVGLDEIVFAGIGGTKDLHRILDAASIAG
jgi:5,10-methylenetetrahydromethanopterin reductase